MMQIQPSSKRISNSVMDNKIFIISTGSRISAFLEKKKKKRLEGNTPQCEQWFHCITFCYFSNGKILTHNKAG